MDNLDKVLDTAKEFDGAQFSETPPAGVEESLVQAVVMHEAGAPSTRATQVAINPVIDVRSVLSLAPASTASSCATVRKMLKPSENTMLARAVSPKLNFGVLGPPVAGQTRIQSRHPPRILAH